MYVECDLFLQCGDLKRRVDRSCYTLTPPIFAHCVSAHFYRNGSYFEGAYVFATAVPVTRSSSYFSVGGEWSGLVNPWGRLDLVKFFLEPFASITVYRSGILVGIGQQINFSMSAVLILVHLTT